MEYNLRGHHLLCLLGYRGMGYSEEYAKEMTKLHTQLRTTKNTLITLVAGPDDLCANFPADKPYHCNDRVVHERDANILAALGLEIGVTYTWNEIEKRIAGKIVREDIPIFCSTCPWLPYGVCEEGVDLVRRGEGLVKVRTE